MEKWIKLKRETKWNDFVLTGTLDGISREIAKEKYLPWEEKFLVRCQKYFIRCSWHRSWFKTKTAEKLSVKVLNEQDF